MTHRAPPLPATGDWLAVGVRIIEELHAGKQSKVFAATINDRQIALKLTDAGLADPATLAERMRVVDTLAAGDASADSGFGVAEPVRLNGEPVLRLGGWLVTATRFVDGTGLDGDSKQDATTMGQTLAVLHRQLAGLPAFSIPPVAALRNELDDSDRFADSKHERGDWQLQHGDFSHVNLIRTSDGLRLIDFDDCGYGPPAYDIANALYMVLFDSEIQDRSDRYQTFRPAFLEGYDQKSGSGTNIEQVDAMIDLRVDALARWLGDLSTAPIGIRTASSAWHGTLRAFVSSYAAMSRHRRR